MTLGLSQITNNAEATIKFLEKYGQYFDRYFITVADKTDRQAGRLRELNDPKLILSYFKWKDDFAAARNYNLKQIDTDYWMWADSDDDIINPGQIKAIVGAMQKESIEVVQLKYDYAQNKTGEAISDHWRERIIKRSYEGKWDAPVHETFQGPPARVEQIKDVEVKHDKAQVNIKRSMERNKRILLKHWNETKDPRDAFYLGMTAMANHDYRAGIGWFVQHIDTSGSDQDKYRSWCRIADCEMMRHKFDQSLYATDEAIKILPSWPDAYFIKVVVYGMMERFEDGIEWLKVAMSKPIPETLHMIDPTLYEYRGLANGAQCLLFNGQVKEAFQVYELVKKKNPEFWKEMSEEDGVQWERLFEEAYFDQKAIDYIRWLLYYTKDNGGNPSKLFESLSPKLFADVRLNVERAKFLTKKKWPEKSIVIYCGQSGETWGPDTLDKGMGGSEEAIVYLTRELAHLGWDVTVFNDREEEYIDGNYKNGKVYGWTVRYKPWTLLNPNDEFDVFVAWRNPSLARVLNIKARKTVVDMHDVPQGIGAITKADAEKNDLFMFKSEYHKSLAPAAKDKAVVIGNGILKEQFK